MLGKTHRLGGIAFGGIASVVIEKGLHVGHADPIAFTLVAMAGGAVGSLVPDLDSKGSILSKKFKLASSAVRSIATHRGATHTLLGLIVFSVCSFLLTMGLDKLLLNNDMLLIRLLFGLILGLVGHTSAQFILTSIKKTKVLHVSSALRLQILVGSFIVPVIIAVLFEYMLIPYIGAYLLGCSVGYFSHLVYDSFTISGVPLLAPVSDKNFRLFKFRTGETFRYTHENQKGRGIEYPLSIISIIVAFICFIAVCI